MKWRPKGWPSNSGAEGRMDFDLTLAFEDGADLMYELAVRPLQAERDKLREVLEKIAQTRMERINPYVDSSGLEHLVITSYCKIDNLIEIAKVALEEMIQQEEGTGKNHGDPQEA